jgi:sugar transferase (PEP-CTERM/EpsH1 system associated)
VKVLLLSTWFPYPPNQGSKIRAYHLLRALARRHEVALVSFEDAPLEPAWIEHVRQFCSIIEIVPRRPFARSRLQSWLGWFSLRPSAVVAGYSPEMSASVRRVAASWRPDMTVALTFVTAPYALESGPQFRVVDVDNLLAHMLYEEYQQAKSMPQKIRRYLAYWKLRRYESELYRQFDLCLVTSARDCRRIAEYIPLASRQIGLVPNGVDLEYYRPDLDDRPGNRLVFNGALTYHPNYDAMDYFLREIFPRVQADAPEATLTITGATQGAPVDALPASSRVTFTGYVDDIRPVVARSSVCVVPLRKGAGTRLKILEAMALGTPVISTSKGAEGLGVESGKQLLIADEPAEFADHTIRLIHNSELRGKLAANAIHFVREKYDWNTIGQHFCQLVDTVAGSLS